MAGVRFAAGFGKTLSKLLKKGIGVHHAGMLPRYRRLVEQLAQAGLLTVICGTDTLGVGINVPIRTVLFTGLAKFDGRRQRILRTREFLQIAGRAGRAGYDTAGYVVVQAPEHVIENERAKAKSAAKNAAMSEAKLAKKKSKAHLKKPPEGTVVWTEQTFDKLVAGVPEPLVSRMKVDNAMLVNVLSREEDAFPVLRRLLTDNHSDPREQRRLARRALRLARSLLRSGILTRLDEPDQFGRRYVLTVDLPEDFALNQELAHFALAALDVLDPEAETYPLDVVSVIEAVLEPPRQVLWAQQHEARGEAIAGDEGRRHRVRRADAAARGGHLAAAAGRAARGDVRALPREPPVARPGGAGAEDGGPGDVGAGDGVHRLRRPLPAGPLRGAGAALPHRRLPHAAPDRPREAPLAGARRAVEWLGETVRQIDSSLLDEWEALADPAHVRPDVADHAPPPPPRPISAQARPFRVMIRNALWRRVELAARDDVTGLAALESATAQLADPPLEVAMTRATGTPRWRATTPTTTRSASTRTPGAPRCWRSRPPAGCGRPGRRCTTRPATTTG